MRNYRHIGTNAINYLSGLGSGKSQSSGSCIAPMLDSMILKESEKLIFKERLTYVHNDSINARRE